MGRRLRYGALAALLAAGVAVLWGGIAGRTGGEGEREDRDASRPEAVRSEPPPRPALTGRGGGPPGRAARGDARGPPPPGAGPAAPGAARAPPPGRARPGGGGAPRGGAAGGPAGPPPAPGAAAEASGPESAPSDAPAVQESAADAIFLRLRAMAFKAVAPAAVEDGVAPGASLPLPFARADVVGRVGPFGVRDGGADGVLRWVGVAQIERESRATSEAADDTREPATTAVRGVVVGEDGNPIAGAEVLLYSSFYLRQAYYDHRVRQIGRAMTDADGAFDLRPISLDTVHFGADGEVLVTVRHDRYPDLVAQPLPAIVPGRESDVGRLTLPAQGVTLRGVVRDLAGRPVPGAVLRASGAFNPIDYDKTERMVVLDECPYATTDAEGRYALVDFAPGTHEISVHIRIDCVLHVSERWEGEREWSPHVRAGNAVRGRVVDPDGEPVAAAVVAGGSNWTPSNADGTFWLDNVDAGPLTLTVSHHAWFTTVVPGVPTNAEDVTITMERPLPRVTLTVVDSSQAPVPLVAIDWTYPPGGGPGPFAPDSRYWHDPGGVFALIVPEGVSGATVSDAKGRSFPLAPADLLDGVRKLAILSDPPAAR